MAFTAQAQLPRTFDWTTSPARTWLVPGPQQAFCGGGWRALTLSGALADPFADAADTEDSGKDYVHIRVQQRNGKKSLTTIQVRSLHAIILAFALRASRLWVVHAVSGVWVIQEFRFVMLATQLADMPSNISSCHG